MLRYLRIRNLAIIDEVEVEFGAGFNVLTGETGAGKSIIIGALNLLMGAKSSPDLLRTGEAEADVEGMFEIPEAALVPRDLDDFVDGARELILSRRVFSSGRSRCFINGNLTTQSALQSLRGSLVRIFGQHEQQTLLNPDDHAEILDRFGGLEPLTRAVSDAYHAMRSADRGLAEAQRRLDELEDLRKANAEDEEELLEAALEPNEEDELSEERELLNKAVQIRERAFEAYQGLYSGSRSVIDQFADVRKAVDFLVSANSKLESLKENLEEAIYRVEDLAQELRHVAEAAQDNPSRLEHIEQRLAAIRRLKRKHGTDVAGLIEKLETLSSESGEIIDVRATVKRLSRQVEERRAEFFAEAQKLSDARREAANKLTKSMKEELADLAMPEAEFVVMFKELDRAEASVSGLERVEFLLAANPGESPRPLARIASGGELSRIMLALKSLPSPTEARPSTMIFDEVDAGIGGRTALAVASRLARVAAAQQVLCVTHLHQIAALGDRHISVRKSVKEGRTSIEVVPLTGEARIEELTRMIGAPPSSTEVKEHLRRLMDIPSAETIN